MNIEQNSNISKEEYMEFYLAEDKDTIEKLLKKMGKKTLKDKYMFLYSLMGFSETYNCENFADEEERDNKEYQACLSIFLEGTWRVI